jgi:hypothetical protein
MAYSEGMSKLLEVACPCCDAILRVDPATGAVITHKEKERPKPVEDLQAAVARIKADEAARGEKFQQQMERERQSKDVLNRKFDELLKQAKQDPDKGPPRKPLGFD